MPLRWLAVFALQCLWAWCAAGCRPSNKEVGICLHVYLERDFLSMERLVFRKKSSNYNKRSAHHISKDDHKSGWVEGPELEDYCNRLKEVLDCFEEVLINCDNGKDFFRYRHLLHSLDKVHHLLCSTNEVKTTKFITFLRTIECAEDARVMFPSCSRNNVTSNIWNKILRAEIGTEICHALNTQRSCLLEHGYLLQTCGDDAKVDIYQQVSGLFLSTWCNIPPHPNLFHDLSPALYNLETHSSKNSYFLSSSLLNVLFLIMYLVL